MTIVKAVCGASMAAVTLIDAERQWFKSIKGTEIAHELRRFDLRPCDPYSRNEVMVVEDAAAMSGSMTIPS